MGKGFQEIINIGGWRHGLLLLFSFLALLFSFFGSDTDRAIVIETRANDDLMIDIYLLGLLSPMFYK